MDQALKVFIKVVEERNFSKAANLLHMTQPAVSQYIRSLENEMGVKLLERTNKYVRLNKAGEIVYHHAKEIIELHEKMHILIEDLSTQASGKISVGASYTFGEYILPRFIAELKASYPNIDVTVTISNTSTIADLVRNRHLDVGIVEGHFKDGKELCTEIFAEDQMVIFSSSSHKLAKCSKTITTEQLAEETWILREEGSGTREAADSVFKQLNFCPSTVMQFSSTQPIKSMVEAGAGISLLSEWAIQKEIRYGDLKILTVEGIPFSRNFAIVTSSTFQTKALSLFIELLKTKQELKVMQIRKSKESGA